MDLVQLSGRPGEKTRPRFWRSLEEYAETDEFRAYLRDEFPSQLGVWEDPVGRRQFLTVMGASLALAGISGCAFQMPETIVPYTQAPEEFVPGKPLFFATALPIDGYAAGVLVESNMGRPTKIEGNPDHPASVGGTSARIQAEILNFYDPDRSKNVLLDGRVSTWERFLDELITLRAKAIAAKGAGLRLLTGTVASPTLAAQIKALLTLLPEARWHQHDPVGRRNTRAGATLAFGTEVDTVRHFDKADVILAVDADFLGDGPAHMVDSRRYAERREPIGDADVSKANRLYVVDSTPTITGAAADHLLVKRPSQVAGLLRAIAKGLGVPVAGDASADDAAWVAAVVKDLQAHKGTSLVLVGEPQPPEIHALGHAINQALGNVGQTLDYIEPVAATGESLAGLVRDIDDGKVDTLFLLGGNPVYDSPADVDFARAIDFKKVATTVHLGLSEDETARLCRWHIPGAHALESWGDLAAFDGTVTIQQPLIEPIYQGKSVLTLVTALVNGSTLTDREVVRKAWETRGIGADFESSWRSVLHKGVVPGTAAKPKAVTLAAGPFGGSAEVAGQGLEIVFRADASVGDGSFANNAWMQELPDPITKITWDNAALMSKKTAEKLGVRTDHMSSMDMINDLVTITYKDRTLTLPAWWVPGQPDDTVTVHLGYGRTKAGRVGDGVGGNVYALRTSAAPWFDAGAKVVKAEGTYRLATMQHFQNIDVDALGDPINEQRHLIRYATLEDFIANPKFAADNPHHMDPGLTLYPEAPSPRNQNENQGVGNSWAMVINTNVCFGCNACVVACQAENNIPVVGKKEVLMGRNMHWLRVDRYYEGNPDGTVKTHFQPIPCMHCETAPCEVVCPFAATVHDAEGINLMIYNRCAGTKFCSNNCPYKVRRFNFLSYVDHETETLKLQRNPEVSVRARGVMEKCSYCVQRLWAAKIQAEKKRDGDPKVLDGEVTTACAGACPTKAITFGNKNDPNSAIVKARANPRHYALLAELNTRPRTTYLAKLVNPNPEIEGAK